VIAIDVVDTCTAVQTGAATPSATSCHSLAARGRIAAAAAYQISSQKGKGSLYSITERRVLELIRVLGSQPAGDVTHKPGGRLPLLSARPTVTLATFKRAATNFAAW